MFEDKVSLILVHSVLWTHLMPYYQEALPRWYVVVHILIPSWYKALKDVILTYWI